MHRHTKAFLAILALAGVAPGQADAPAAAARDPEQLVERFRALGFRQQAAIVSALQRQVALLSDPLIARVADLALAVDELPEAPAAAPIHDPSTWASAEHAAGRAPSRKPLERTSAKWRAAAERFAHPAFLPDLAREVEYDWQSGRIVRNPALDYVQVFANFAHGYAPGSDHAVAKILEALDRDTPTRPLADWFGHGYCDLDARSYPGLTLYDAWYSGEVVDVPDVDAIPFARRVLDDQTLHSPLSGPPRDRLYQQIAAAARRYRVHRTTAEAAAAAFVAAEPVMDPMYALLVPRFHYLFASGGDSLDAVAATVRGTDRDAILADVDRQIREPDGKAYEVREGRAAELAATRERIRALASAALERFAGG